MFANLTGCFVKYFICVEILAFNRSYLTYIFLFYLLHSNCKLQNGDYRKLNRCTKKTKHIKKIFRKQKQIWFGLTQSYKGNKLNILKYCKEVLT